MTAPLLLSAPGARRRAPLASSRDSRVVRASRVAPAVLTTVPSLIILGADAVLAAGPATPVQLAHACLAAGYQAVIPASWGDELIAARVIDRLRGADGPVVQCSCPYVSRRLATHGETIAAMLLSLAAPPVATAEYLRAVYGSSRPRITYAGGCPSASHGSIDVWLSADELMSALAERGISATAQPTEFDSVLPPDRRRYFSEPGGVPARHALRQLPGSVEFIELKGGDLVVEIAQHLLAGSRALIDVALPLGCCCSGVSGVLGPDAARARVRDLEPPRALSPVVDHALKLALDESLPSAGARPEEIARDAASDASAAHGAVATVPPPLTGATPATPVGPSGAVPRTPRQSAVVAEPPTPLAIELAPRRRSPLGLSRPVLGAMPISRSEAGRHLPRAYVARRRSSPRGLRQSSVKDGPALPRPDERRRWLLIGAAGVAIGLGIAWLILMVL